MLDDLTLERLLGDAADEIAVPGDGPDRILAARDAFSPARRPEAEPARRPEAEPARRRPGIVDGVRRRPLRAAVAVVASCVLVGVVAGVASGGGGSQVSGPAERSSAGGAAPLAPTGAAGGAASSATAASGTPAPAAAPVAGQQATPNFVPGSTGAKVIKNGSMTLRVKSVESTVEQLGNMAGNAGGYISSSSLNVPGDGQPSSADVTIRVPEASFESFTSQVEALGSPSRVAVSGQDVTSQYADLKSRLQAVQSTISQLELIETKAQTIGDTLAVEQQISSQQSQADELQGQINVLDDQTADGSLAVHVVEPQKKAAAAPPPPSGISRAWDHARHGFAHGVEAVIGALGGVAVFLLFAGLLIGLARLGWVMLRRRLV